MTTFAQALDKIGVTLPDHLVADAEVPVITEPQAQGDLLIVPSITLAEDVKWENVPDKGIQVVVGEATGNTHWLHRGFDSPGVRFARIASGQLLAAIEVPAGQTAELIHTDEHGCNALGEGTFGIYSKREFADEIRAVAD
jgi:hypothetical protein